MFRKIMLATVALAALSLPAAAATSYYVGKVAKTGKCEVTSSKPDGTKIMMIGEDAFSSKAKATAALKAASDCK